jgi:hypothetical protein
MKLLGERNWYLPGWLQGLPHFDIEGHAEQAGGGVTPAPSRSQTGADTVSKNTRAGEWRNVAARGRLSLRPRAAREAKGVLSEFGEEGLIPEEC